MLPIEPFLSKEIPMRHRMAFAGLLAILLLWCVPTISSADDTFVLQMTTSPDRPFTLPLDTNALTYQHGWRIGPDGRPYLGTSAAWSPSYSGANLGLQVRFGVSDNPLEVVLHWNGDSRNQDAKVETRLAGSPKVETIYCFAPPCPSPRLVQRVDEQVNLSTASQSTSGLGISYDMLMGRSKHIVFAPGGGVQCWSVKLERNFTYTSSNYRSPLVGDGPTTQEILETDSDEETTSHLRLQTYASMDVQVWPFSEKRKGLGIVAHGKYVFGDTDRSRTDTALLGGYQIPIRQEPWQVHLGVVLGF